VTSIFDGERARDASARSRRRGHFGGYGEAPLEIGLSAFSFRDSVGVSYAASGASTTLRPGQSTALDLALPLPKSRGLTLVITLPPDPPIEQVLMVETKM